MIIKWNLKIDLIVSEPHNVKLIFMNILHGATVFASDK